MKDQLAAEVRLFVTIVIIWGFLCMQVPIARGAVPGAQETDFGAGAPVMHDIGGGDDAADIVVREDGKLMVAGTVNQAFPAVSTQDFYLARMNSDGSLDGFATTDFDGRADTALGMMAYPDDRTLVVGMTNLTSGSTDRRIAMARYLSNGNLDTTFDTDGKVIFTMSGLIKATAAALQEDGKIVVLADTASPMQTVILRFNPNGSQDTGFGTGGSTVIPGSIQVVGTDILVRPDGRILLSTYSDNTIVVARLTSAGILDTTFDTDGIVQTDFDGGLEGPHAGLAVQADNRILVGGSAAVGGVTGFAVVRYLPGGALDTTFDGDGKAWAPYPGASASGGDAMVLQSGGKIVLVGSTTDGVASVRFNPNGSLDNSYGTGGFSFKLTDTELIRFRSCVLYGDSIVAAGLYHGSIGSRNSFFVKLSLTPEASAPADFDGDGKTDLSTFRASNGGWYVLNSRTNTFTASFFGTTGDIPIDTDLDGDRRNDLVVFRPTNGTWHTQKSSTGAYAPVNWGANGDKPVAADYDRDGRTDIGVWRPSNGIYYILKSSDSSFFITQWGASGDIPIGGSPQ